MASAPESRAWRRVRPTPAGAGGSEDSSADTVLDVCSVTDEEAAGAAGDDLSGDDGKVAAGLAVLDKLHAYETRTLKRDAIIMLVGRLTMLVTAMPLLWQYENNWLLPVATWALPNLLFALPYGVLLTTAKSGILHELRRWPAAVRSAAECKSSVDRGMLSAYIFSPVLVLSYWFGIAAPSGAPLWLAVLCTAILFLVIVSGAVMWTGFSLPTIVVLLVHSATDAVYSQVDADVDFEQLREQLRRLGKLYDAAWRHALYGVSEVICNAISGITFIFPTLLLTPLNSAFLVMVLLLLVSIIAARLPSADCMTRLVALPQHISRTVVHGRGVAAARRSEAMAFIQQLQSAHYGWYVSGGIPLTTALLNRVRTVLVPVVALIGRELL